MNLRYTLLLAAAAAASSNAQSLTPVEFGSQASYTSPTCALEVEEQAAGRTVSQLITVLTNRPIFQVADPGAAYVDRASPNAGEVAELHLPLQEVLWTDLTAAAQKSLTVHKSTTSSTSRLAAAWFRLPPQKVWPAVGIVLALAGVLGFEVIVAAHARFQHSLNHDSSWSDA